ncbi:MAG: 4Fe-4S binding protein, partial [candidate division Zixibacteria bacterium]|nr:4Fe-4S binding protein [candidate division Zixibacteria bacterium]
MRQTAIIEAATKPTLRQSIVKPIQKYRFLIQIGFALLCIWIGVEFHFFVEHIESGGAVGSSYRPPGVEGFLPISSLMSLYYFFLTGDIHPAHPAGVLILVAILVVSFVFGKSFCSWICPVGLISETVGDLGEKIFRRKMKLPRLLDYPLRSLKYLLLGFFVYSIFFLMSTAALRAFLDSPYNLVADIKMYYFFAEMSRFVLTVIAALLVLSIVIRNFWCRYLCPYGALLGLISLISPHKIRRNASNCIDCGKCTEVCPSHIEVEKLRTVVSDECTTCLACVDICPTMDTLSLELTLPKRRIPRKVAAIVIVGLFVLITGFGIVGGNWQNNISTEEYLYHQENLKSYG